MTSTAIPAKASGHLFARYGIHAEWARLKEGPDQPPIFRGCWYRVADYDPVTDLVTLDIDDIDGDEAMIRGQQLKLARNYPEKATVYSTSTFSPARPEMVYEGRCPKRHKIPHVNLAVQSVRCGGCAGDYQWEHEEGAAAPSRLLR